MHANLVKPRIRRVISVVLVDILEQDSENMHVQDCRTIIVFRQPRQSANMYRADMIASQKRSRAESRSHYPAIVTWTKL